MLFVSTAEDPADPVGKLVNTEQPLGLNYLPLAMNPLRLDRIEPRALGGQQTRHYSHPRSEEHTSELQSRQYLVCRLLLEKKNNIVQTNLTSTYCIPSFCKH